VSTDEVYGALGESQAPVTEEYPLNPTSPYAASKAAADHIVGAFVRTHGLDAVITRSCNTYGPRQYPEKLIPLMIKRALNGAEMPVYGDGMQRREWMHVDDHCRGLVAALRKGRSGMIYNLGTAHEEVNKHVVERIVQLTGASPSQVVGVQDRPAHDRRYALDSSRAASELGWKPDVPFSDGLMQTVAWYTEKRSALHS
jgi:dTDP-glucose 4,6-dehydratase